MGTKLKLWKLSRKVRRVKKKAAGTAQDALEIAKEVVGDAVESGRESLKSSKRRHDLDEKARDLALAAAETLEDAAQRFKERQVAKLAKNNGHSPTTGESQRAPRKRTTKRKSSAKSSGKKSAKK